MASDIVYIATAYRFGRINGGDFLVCATTDRDKAIAMACQENTESAGKYAVSVTVAETGEQVAYYPSSYGESRAEVNRRIALADRLGQHVLSEIEDGKVPIPDWLRKRYEFELLVNDAMFPPPSPQPERTDE